MDRARLLVVDDDPASPDVVRRHLAGVSTLDVSVAGSGLEAIEAVKRAAARGEPFDGVLLEFYMPGMNGIDALKALRDQGSDARVILTSGHEPRDAAVEAMRPRAVDFIGKPLNPAEL